MTEWRINRRRLQYEMARRSLRQTDLGKLVGTSGASISRILAGLQQSPRLVARMATVLGLAFEDVVQIREKGSVHVKRAG